MATNVVNDFHECLAASHAAHDLPLWEELYRAAFPTLETMTCCRSDGEHQRQGIDRVLVLSNGKPVSIDEKVRGRSKLTGKVYDDIALEYVSNSRRKTPGWVCKPLLCDYIAYAIAPLGRGYLLPVVQLQAAWAKWSWLWLNKYTKITAQNAGYQTLSLCMPPDVVLNAVTRCLQVQFTATEV